MLVPSKYVISVAAAVNIGIKNTHSSENAHTNTILPLSMLSQRSLGSQEVRVKDMNLWLRKKETLFEIMTSTVPLGQEVRCSCHPATKASIHSTV